MADDNQTDDPLLLARQKKIAELRAKGGNPYITAIKPKNLARDLKQSYDHFTKEELEAKRSVPEPEIFSIAGRLMLHRSFGKSTFMTIRDRSGRFQAFAQQSKLSPEIYEFVKHADLGDIVFVEGALFKTKTGELTIDCHRYVLLTKNTRPLPEKFHGLSDIEARYRQRYLDLICNDHVHETFVIRSKIIQGIREFFLKRDYMEVETPMLHPLVGGAMARPFKTFHNTLKMNLFLRIAPELYLKRLVVGGFDRVFEINRCFRNEGISVKHNPEFTMLEFYEAFATYHDQMNLTEDLLNELAVKILGSETFDYQGHSISFKKPFKKWSVPEVIREFGGVDSENTEEMLRRLKSKGAKLNHKEKLAEIQWLYFEHFVEEKLIQPTFVIDHPIEISPLARRSDERPEIAERFELYVAGCEIANGFNELNDPVDQRERFLNQLKRKAEGDEEASDYDEDYIHALEYGLPPTSGEGIGIDRLTMLFTNSASIRDVILFPQMRGTHSENDV